MAHGNLGKVRSERTRAKMSLSQKAKYPWTPERDATICARALAGELHTTIAADFGMTRERVRQIVLRDTRRTGRDGQAMRAVLRMGTIEDARAAKKEARRKKRVEDVRPLVEARARGEKLEAIAAQIGTHLSGISRKLQWASAQPEFANA